MASTEPGVIHLGQIQGENRLFTYKVAHDAGSAPNPYHGICTLAICKPAIRAVAVPGDVVVGFSCGADSNRIVYCMRVKASLSWEEYIQSCSEKPCGRSGSSALGLRKKIPVGPHDPGDCIWRNATEYGEALDSWSGHGGQEDYERDVIHGKKVLVGNTFWYFGKGEPHCIRVPTELQAIVPNRGHRSNANTGYRNEFVDFFNRQLLERKIEKFGLLGTPALQPEMTDKQTSSRCRAQERSWDAEAEEA
jgi:hypothetical protein